MMMMMMKEGEKEEGREGQGMRGGFASS